jgi:BirA family transcriptional regulator, biotin operon repressor / biotin---[acetyl-CoA-carboxylase] ligase
MHLALAFPGVRVQVLESVGSTNEHAFACARSGERGPLWIVARRQTCGRGRRGRAWVSDPGNLYASLLLTDPAPADRAAELSFVAALAVHDAIVMVAPALGPRLGLKWPNDVLVDGAKVAGILVEGESSAVKFVTVVGIGVNCTSHPSATVYPATDLVSAGAMASFEALSAALITASAERLRQWDRGAGFASIRADWLDRATGIGSDIRIAAAQREIVGRFETLDSAGRLVLKRPDGQRELVAAGEIFPMRHASAEPAL